MRVENRLMLGSQLLVTLTVIQFLIEPIYKVWFTIRNTVGDSKIELPIKPIMPER